MLQRTLRTLASLRASAALAALAVIIAAGLLSGPAGLRPGRQNAEASRLSEVRKLLASDAEKGDLFGISVAMSGDTAIVGARSEDEGGSDAGAAYVLQRDEGGADNWGEVKKLLASDAHEGDLFGVSVAISGDTAVVGAYRVIMAGRFMGAAYVFQRDEGGAGNWGEVKKLTASDAYINDRFGSSVAVSGDTVVVGAERKDIGDSTVTIQVGAAYVFQRDEGGADNWGELKTLRASDGQHSDFFGGSVALSGDTVIVGAGAEDAAGTNAGAAYVFERQEGGPGNWGEVKKLTASDAQEGDRFGGSVALSGDIVVLGAPGGDARGINSGAAYVLGRDVGGPGNWGEVKKIIASDTRGNDNFGSSVAVSGDTAVVGARFEDPEGEFKDNFGAAHAFRRDEDGAGNWGEVAKLTASDGSREDRLGESVAVAGDTALVGAYLEDAAGGNAGAAYLFDLLVFKPFVSPTPTPVPGVMEVDCDASRGGIQTNCAYPAGASFQVEVHVTQPPAGGYFEFQAKLGWTEGAVNYLPAPAGADEALWPDCTIAVRENNWEVHGVPSLIFGCASLPRLTVGATFTGAMFTFEFQCKRGPDSDSAPAGLTPSHSVLDLISSMDELPPVQGGSFFVSRDHQAIHPGLIDAAVTCGNGPAPSSTPLSPPATPAPTSTPLTPPGTPNPAGAMAVDCDASQGGIQTDCTYAAGSSFQVEVHVTQPPAGGYFEVQAKLGWTEGAVNYLPAPDEEDEALWPDCTIAVRANNWERIGVSSLLFGCAPLPRPAVGATFTGAIFTFEFQCKSGPHSGSPPAGLAPNQSVLDLMSRLNEEPPLQGGSFFVSRFHQPINPGLVDATVTCGDGPAPTPTPLSTPATPAPTSTPLTPPGTPNPAGAMAVDCDASQGGIQTNCTYAAGSSFQVEVHVTQPPADGYFQIQAKLGWTEGAVRYLPAAPSAEALWSNCTIAASVNNWERIGVPSLVIACAPLPALAEGDSFTGAVFTFEFQCESLPAGSPPAGLAPNQAVLDLISSVNEPAPAQGGTIFLAAGLRPIAPALVDATITCGNGPAPTQTPLSTPATPAPVPTPASAPDALVFVGEVAVTDAGCGGGDITITLNPAGTEIVSLSVAGLDKAAGPDDLVTEFDPPIAIEGDSSFYRSAPLPSPLDMILATFEGTFNFAADPAIVSGTLTIAFVEDPSVVLCAADFSAEGPPSDIDIAGVPLPTPSPTAAPPLTSTPVPTPTAGAPTAAATPDDLASSVQDAMAGPSLPETGAAALDAERRAGPGLFAMIGALLAAAAAGAALYSRRATRDE